MSEGLNQCTLVGNLGSDPELRHTNGGQSVLQIRLATSETYLDKDKQRQERTEWHTVVIWGKRAEALSRILSRGAKIVVTGRIQTTSWETNEGEKRYRTQIAANNIILCGGGRSAGSESGPPPRDDRFAPSDEYSPSDDDIPF
jgi:single-strand DNA-binding protein